MNQRTHLMPFGSEILNGGGVRFRLWAPRIPEVRLHLEGAEPLELAMARDRKGWHRLDVAEAGPGTRYRFRLPEGQLVPDPASRFNPEDVHGPSEVIDPRAFVWPDDGWQGRPWEEAVIYELHLGTFSPSGDFAGVEARLDYLAELGITAIEIMPVADFPGRRNWGYDGVLEFAPDSVYGRPEEFKRLIAAAQSKGLMVILDVVHNHFGPEGNYLYGYGRDFFNERHHTPWGAAINFDGDHNRGVRDFFIHNALFWLEEYRLDGLRLDAIHAICDDSSPDIVEELATAVWAGPGREHQVHLILENDRNQSRYLERGKMGEVRQATAQWNDDIHHAFHILATGERDGYYADYAADPLGMLARCLTEGFAFQGEPSGFRDGENRGERSTHLPPAAFVNFLQTHDQVGNRAFGERLCHLAPAPALEALTALLLLAPQVPLLFMGEEFAASQPFLFFCDFGPDLAQAVTEGRRREFARFERFADPAVRESIPDPIAESTFAASHLDWSALERPPHRETLALHRRLLDLRRRRLVPRLAGMAGGTTEQIRLGPQTLNINWRLGDGSRLELHANLGPEPYDGIQLPVKRLLFATSNLDLQALASGHLAPWSAIWLLKEENA